VLVLEGVLGAGAKGAAHQEARFHSWLPGHGLLRETSAAWECQWYFYIAFPQHLLRADPTVQRGKENK